MIIECPSCGDIDSIVFFNPNGEINIKMENGWIHQICVCKNCDFHFHIKANFDIKIKNIKCKEW